MTRPADRCLGRLRPGTARRRGLTLLELLIALSIFAMLGAVSYASLRPLLLTERGVGAREAIDRGLEDARRAAMQEGAAVAIRISADGTQLTIDALVPGDAGAGGPSGNPGPGPGLEPDETPAARVAARLGRSALIRLPSGVRLQLVPPTADELDAEFGDAADGFGAPDVADRIVDPDERWADADLDLDAIDAQAAGPDSGPSGVRLVIFGPDGAAIIARPAWMIAPDASVAALTIHPWSGVADWAPATPNPLADPLAAGGADDDRAADDWAAQMGGDSAGTDTGTDTGFGAGPGRGR